MLRGRDPCILQCVIERRAHLVGRHSAIELLAIDEQRGSGIHAEIISFFHGGAHRLVILRLEAGLELRLIEIVFFRLLHGEAIELRVFPLASFVHGDGVLIGVEKIGVVPIGVTGLSGQAIGIDGGVNGPGVNLLQWVILVDDQQAVAVLLENLWKERGMHTRAEGAFEVVVVDDDDLGVFVAANGTAGAVDFLHRLSEGIRREIHAGNADEGLVIAREKKIVGLLFVGGRKGDGNRIEVREFAGMQTTENDLDVGRKRIMGAHLTINLLDDVAGKPRSRGGRVGGRGRRGGSLSRTARTNDKKSQTGATKPHKEKPPAILMKVESFDYLTRREKSASGGAPIRPPFRFPPQSHRDTEEPEPHLKTPASLF